MPTLREIQLGFAEALTSESAAERFAPWVCADGLGGERRVRIYRNNLMATLSGALEAVYPVVRRLVGEGFFASAARAYVHAHPSLSGDVHRYGNRFGAFLAGLPVTADYPYLADVAALEWAYHEVFHTEPAPPVSMEALQALPPERYAELRFALQPAARLLASEYPVLRIWQVNQPDWVGEQRVDLAEGGARVLVVRRGSGIELEALSRGEGLWLGALARGCTLVESLEETLAADPEFDPGPALARRIAEGVLVAPTDTHPNA